MKWPTHADYQESIQNPSFCLKDPDLKAATVACNMLGLPKVMSGNFASVYELGNEDIRWAVRCFVRQVPNQHRHYTLLSQHLGSIRPDCLVGFEYILEGIQLLGRWYPIVKMEWVEGDPLNVFLEDYHSDSDLLLGMAQSFRELVNSLIIHQIAHGDLQHGNVMVTPEKGLKLVDYDGMFVPPLGKVQSPELGHANYQHPKRTPHFYDSSLDRFSALVIFTCLRALAADAGLWNRFYSGENLLLTADDYQDPDNSKAFEELLKSPDPTVSKLTQLLRRCCLSNVTEVAEFELMVNAALGPNALPESLLRIPEMVEVGSGHKAIWWEDENSEDEPQPEDANGQPVGDRFNEGSRGAGSGAGSGLDVGYTDLQSSEESFGNEGLDSPSQTKQPSQVGLNESESETSPILWVSLSLASASISFIPGLHLLVGLVGVLVGVFAWSKLPKSLIAPKALVGASIALSALMAGYGALLMTQPGSGGSNASSESKIESESSSGAGDSMGENFDSEVDAANFGDVEVMEVQSANFGTSPVGSMRQAPLVNFVLLDTIASGVGEIWCMQFSAKEDMLALGGASGELLVWSWPEMNLLHTITAHVGGVVDVAFSPDERLIISAGKDKSVRFWNLRSGDLEKEQKDSAWSVFPTRLATDGRLMVTSAPDRTRANIFEPTSRYLIRELPQHSSWISTLELSPDAKWIISICGENYVRAISTGSGKIEHIWNGSRREEALAVAPDGTIVVNANSDHELEGRSLKTGDLLQTYSRHVAPIKVARFSGTGRFLASSGMDEVIKIWDMSRNMSGPTLSDHNGELLTLRFTSDDNYLLAGGEDGRLRIWKKSF